jgi:hypothetical protein
MGGLVQFLLVIKGHLVLASSSCLTSTHGFCSLFWHLLFLWFSSKTTPFTTSQKESQNLGGATHCQLGLFGSPKEFRCLFWESLSLSPLLSSKQFCEG